MFVWKIFGQHAYDKEKSVYLLMLSENVNTWPSLTPCCSHVVMSKAWCYFDSYTATASAPDTRNMHKHEKLNPADDVIGHAIPWGRVAGSPAPALWPCSPSLRPWLWAAGWARRAAGPRCADVSPGPAELPHAGTPSGLDARAWPATKPAASVGGGSQRSTLLKY